MAKTSDPLSAHTHDLLRAWLARTREGVVWIDAEGTILEWNEVAARLWSIERADAIGRNWTDVRALGAITLEAPTPDHSAFRVVLHSNDPPRDISLEAETEEVIDEQGRRVGMLTLIRELAPPTGRDSASEDRAQAMSAALKALRKSHDRLQQTQLQLIQSARLESIGRLAAGVAHEVKNPLAVILGNIQLLRLQTPATSENAELLADMEAATRRANSVVMGLLDFAASTALDLGEVVLEELVAKAIQLVHHDAARRHTRIRHVSEGPLPRLRIDRMKIEQVLINFLMNAADAMESGGEITVRTSLRQLRSAGHGVGYRKTDVLRVGQTVASVEVEDSGSGISPEVLRRAFEPFYTTKGPGKGTGLGLAVCKMIANLHNGSVWLENRAEGGTRATLWLPAGDDQRGSHE